MREIGAFEAKTHLSELLAAAEAGESILITRRGTAVARLVPAGQGGDRASALARVATLRLEALRLASAFGARTVVIWRRWTSLTRPLGWSMKISIRSRPATASIAALLIVRAFGHPMGTALTISASLAQIGEFSFILAGLGVALAIGMPQPSVDARVIMGDVLVMAGGILWAVTTLIVKATPIAISTSATVISSPA